MKIERTLGQTLLNWCSAQAQTGDLAQSGENVVGSHGRHAVPQNQLQYRTRSIRNRTIGAFCAGFGGESVQMERYAAPLNRWYSTHFFPVGERGSGRLAIIVDDVSERKRSEKRLAASEERLRLAIEAGNIGTCDWNYQTGEMRWNGVRFRMYGLEPQDRVMYADDFYAAVHPDDRERVRAEIMGGVEGRGEHAEEYRVVWPDGTVRWIVETGRVVSVEGGRPLRVSSVLLDVTERREAEARVRAAVPVARMIYLEPDLDRSVVAG